MYVVLFVLCVCLCVCVCAIVLYMRVTCRIRKGVCEKNIKISMGEIDFDIIKFKIQRKSYTYDF